MGRLQILRKATERVVAALLEQAKRAKPSKKKIQFVESLETRTLLSGTLLKDIDTSPAMQGPSNLTNVAGTYFFTHVDADGRELWKSDGTESGTVKVKDINPGRASSDPSNFKAIGSTLYFVAETTSGRELWKSDGTSSGTVMVKDIYSGVDDSDPMMLTPVGSTLFFTAQTASAGRELWKSDGTESGTVLVKDINSGSTNGLVSNGIAIGSSLFFVASASSSGSELWISDGTESGTIMVKDIYSGSSGSGPADFTVFDSKLFFSAEDSSNGYELWKSDGTESGTVLVKDINSGSSGSGPNQFKVFDSELYFSANTTSDGSELWKTDGTTSGTVQVKNIYSGSDSSSPSNFTVVGSSLYFTASSSGSGTELWMTDGTYSGTVQVKDIRSGSDGSNPTNMVANGSTVYFKANNGSDGEELWKSDGTYSGTVQVKNIGSGSTGSWPNHLTVADGVVYFDAFSSDEGHELWKSDGTESGTVIVKAIYSGSQNSTPYDLQADGDTLYFFATSPTSGTELWTSDGTESGTVLVKDASAGTSDSNPSNYVTLGNNVFFVADDGENGPELWKTNGTTGGTSLVKDIWSGSNGSNPSNLTVVGSTLYFTANTDAYGNELWKSDGTTSGTVLVKDINDSGSSSPEYLKVIGSNVYFTAQTNSEGRELWKSDGTNSGTVLVKDINSGSAQAQIENTLTVMSGALYFSAYTSSYGSELWTSDGTESGTVIVKDIVSGSSGSGPNKLVAIGNTLYFTAGTSSDGNELWKSDGTDSGTTLVKDIYSGSSSSNPTSLTAVGSTLFFRATTSAEGNELWKSNGTESGTVLVKDIVSGGSSSNPENMIASGGKLYFFAETSSEGRELWKSDGTTGGTALAKDITSGSGSTNLSYMTSINDVLYLTISEDGINILWRSNGESTGSWPILYYSGWGSNNIVGLNDSLILSADDATHGNELWIISPPTADAGSYDVDQETSIELDAGNTSDPDSGTILTYLWDLDDDDIFGETGGSASRGDETGVSPTFSASGLPGDSTYTVSLQVINSAGLMDSTSTVLNIVDPTPTDLVATTSGDHTIDLQWTDNAAHETAYEVMRSVSEGFASYTLVTLPADTTRFRAAGLADDTEYFFRVRAVLSNSANSDWSNVDSAQTVAEPSTFVYVTNVTFNWQFAPQSLVLELDDTVSYLTKDDITLRNLTTSTDVSRNNLELDVDGTTITITWPGLSMGSISGFLPDRQNFELLLEEEAVVGLAEDFVFDMDPNDSSTEPASDSAPTDGDINFDQFFIALGDANHDRSVDFNDLLLIAQNYGPYSAPYRFDIGDFDFNGDVDGDDEDVWDIWNGMTFAAPPKTGNTLVVSNTMEDSNTSLFLDWTSPGISVDSYRVFESLDGTNFTDISDTLNGAEPITDTEITVTGRAVGTKYWYRVRAVVDGTQMHTTNKAYGFTSLPTASGFSVIIHPASGNSSSWAELDWTNPDANANEWANIETLKLRRINAADPDEVMERVLFTNDGIAPFPDESGEFNDWGLDPETHYIWMLVSGNGMNSTAVAVSQTTDPGPSFTPVAYDNLEVEPGASSGSEETRPISPAGVRYADGSIAVSSTDLISTNFGTPWGVTRTWSNLNHSNAATDISMPYGWTMEELPRLIVERWDESVAPAVPSIIAFRMNGTNAIHFDRSGSNWTARFGGKEKLALSSGGSRYFMVDSVGNRYEFFAFAIHGYNQPGGRLARRVTPGDGLVYEVTWDNYRVQTQTRIGEVNGEEVTEQLEYEYGDTGAAEDRVVTITLSRGTSTLNDVRRISYTYHEGDTPFGIYADLKSSVLEEPDGVGWATIDRQYYRYYKPFEVTDLYRVGNIGTAIIEDHDFVVGDKIRFSGATGTSSKFNEEFEIEAIDGNEITFEIYFDTSGVASTAAGEITAIGAGFQSGGGALKYVLTPAAVDRAEFDLETNFEDFDDISSEELRPYADKFITYYRSKRVRSVTMKGVGTTDDDATGHGTFYYSYSHSFNGLDHIYIEDEFGNLDPPEEEHMDVNAHNVWKRRTIETFPDGHKEHVFTSHTGQVMARATFADDDDSPESTTIDGAEVWATTYRYNSAGQLHWTMSASSVLQLDLNLRSLLDSSTIVSGYSEIGDPGMLDNVRPDEGLVKEYKYITSGISEPTADNFPMLTHVYLQKGTNTGTTLRISETTYDSHSIDIDVDDDEDPDLTYDRLVAVSVDDGLNGNETDISRGYWENSLQEKWVRTELPAITFADNGPDDRFHSTTLMDVYGRPVLKRDGDGYLHFIEYDPTTGLSSSVITDVNTDLITTDSILNQPVDYMDEDAGVITLSSPGHYFSKGERFRLIDTEDSGSDWNGIYIVSDVDGDEFSFEVSSAPIDDFNEDDMVARWQTPDDGGLHLESAVTGIDEVGRPLISVDPDGRTTHVRYNDQEQSVTTYRGWDEGPNGPVSVIRVDRGRGYGETLTFIPEYETTPSEPTGDEDIINLRTLARQKQNISGQIIEQRSYFAIPPGGYDVDFDDMGTVASNSTNDSGEADKYFHVSYQGYDAGGRAYRTISPSGTIQKEIYDALGRRLETWVGTDDSVSTSNMVQTSRLVYDEGAVGDSNVTREYRFTDAPDDGATANGQNDRITDFKYDWANRLVVTKTGVSPDGLTEESPAGARVVTVNIYEIYRNLIAAQYILDGDGFDVDAFDADSPATEVSSNDLDDRRRASTVFDYDALGRVYRQVSHGFRNDGTAPTDQYDLGVWYDGRGNIIKKVSAGNAVTKTKYDGAGRVAIEYTTDGYKDVVTPGNPYLTAITVGDIEHTNSNAAANADFVLQQIEFTYDGSGNIILQTTRERMHNAFDFEGNVDDNGEGFGGELGDHLGSDDKVPARVSYVSSYFDAANRLIRTVDVGTFDGNAYLRPAAFDNSANGRDDDVLTVDYRYTDSNDDDIGWLTEVEDPRGIKRRVEYDRLGREVAVIENYDDGEADSDDSRQDDDQITEYTYDGGGRQLTVTAHLSGPTTQTTTYVYEAPSSLDAGSLFSNELLWKVIYPDNGASETDRTETFIYNRLGQQTIYTDRNGTEHEYSYDDVGRLVMDSVSVGAGVDPTVEAIAIGYDDLGRADLYTSIGDDEEVLNQVKRVFNGYGDLTTEFTAIAGEVDFETSIDSETSPFVYYDYFRTVPKKVYAHSRLQAIVYPSGRTIRYWYSGYDPAEWHSEVDGVGVDNRVSRVSFITEDVTPNANQTVQTYDNVYSGDILASGKTHLEQYAYLGLNTVVRRYRPQLREELAYADPANSEGDTPAVSDSDDPYVGLDRFGRVIDQRWVTWTKDEDPLETTIVDHDRFGYAYDRNSNRVYRTNEIEPGFDELYQPNNIANGYDGLNRQLSFQRGTLGDSNTDDLLDISSTSRSQSWNLDELGNWMSVTTDSSTETRTHDEKNRVTETDDGATHLLAYSNNGELLEDAAGQIYVYDAWGRLVSVTPDGSDSSTIYQYDGLNRRILEDRDGPEGSLDATAFYYSDLWQVLEEVPAAFNETTEIYEVETREVGDHELTVPSATYTWSPVYVDSLIVRDRDADGNNNVNSGHVDGYGSTASYGGIDRLNNGTTISVTGPTNLEERSYVQQDANFNVTSLFVDSDGRLDSGNDPDTNFELAERYIYDPYGQRTVLDGDWDVDEEIGVDGESGDDDTAVGNSDFDFLHGHQGGREMWVTNDGDLTNANLVHFRNRDLHTLLGRWTSEDALGFVDGPNLYQGYTSAPASLLDPLGLRIIPTFDSSQRLALDALNNWHPTGDLDGDGQAMWNPGWSNESDWFWDRWRGINDILDDISSSGSLIDQAFGMAEFHDDYMQDMVGSMYTTAYDMAEFGADFNMIMGIATTAMAMARAGFTRNGYGRGGMAGGKNGCFIAGTPVLLGDHKTLINIEKVKVGDRLATDGGVSNSGRLDADPNHTNVTEGGYRHVSLRMETVLDDGTRNRWNIETLQPLEWLIETNAFVGGFVSPPIDFTEIGVPEGLRAKVIAIDSIPKIDDGPGRVVLTTIDRLAGNIYNLALVNAEGKADTLGVTGVHRFYSESRGWVHAEDLKNGEILRSTSGRVTVKDVLWTPVTKRVYNFTVEADHVYYVGDLSTLTHNQCRFYDPASRADLRHKSLNSGTTELQKAGLRRIKGDKGAYLFVDSKGHIRAKYVPRSKGEPAHWSKFPPGGANQKQYLNNAGRVVDSTDRSHRIPSTDGSPRGGTGPGSPSPV